MMTEKEFFLSLNTALQSHDGEMALKVLTDGKSFLGYHIGRTIMDSDGYGTIEEKVAKDIVTKVEAVGDKVKDASKPFSVIGKYANNAQGINVTDEDLHDLEATGGLAKKKIATKNIVDTLTTIGVQIAEKTAQNFVEDTVSRWLGNK